MKLLAVVFAIPLFACTVGGDDPTSMGDDGDEHMDPSPTPTPMPTGDGVSGTISANTTWMGPTRIKGDTTIPAGVTVTVAAGTQLTFAAAARITVAGTLKMEGTSASKITGAPEAAGWGGFSVTGTLDLKYVNFTGGSINTSGAASSLVITDTKLYKAGGGDYVIMNGGSINMTYSQIGPAPGETDNTHCNLHINAASSITVTNSNINGAPYGIMFYGGVNANFKSNNWYANPDKDVATQSGVSGDFSNGWFEKGGVTAGPGATITANNLSATRLTNAGPRP